MPAPIRTVPVPPRGPGHCDDDAAWAEFVRQYDGKPRSLPEMSDFALANAVFMADRFDLSLIHYQTAAKERIRWLSIELAKAQAALTAAPVREEGGAVSDAIRVAWGGAMTVACNIAIDEQNRTNDDDGPSEVLNAQGEIIRRLKSGLEIDAGYLAEVQSALATREEAPPAPVAEKLRVALKHYACSCAPGHCAMSADDTEVPVDDQICGRRAAVALGEAGE